MLHATTRLLAQDPGLPSSSIWLFAAVLMGIMFYFMIFRPDRRKRDEVAKMQANLKQRDRIVTIGGIVGVVVNAPKDSEEITIRIDDTTKTRMRILRSAVSRIAGEENEGTKGDE